MLRIFGGKKVRKQRDLLKWRLFRNKQELADYLSYEKLDFYEMQAILTEVT